MARAAWGRGRGLATRGLAGEASGLSEAPTAQPVRRAASAEAQVSWRQRRSLLRARALEAEASREGPRPGLHGVERLVFFVRRPGGVLRCPSPLRSRPPLSISSSCPEYSSWSTVHHGPISGRRLNKPSSKPVWHRTAAFTTCGGSELLNQCISPL
ncbi:hypothetical protein VTN02DRAFT_6488 [Thermoascus thermophilus]